MTDRGLTLRRIDTAAGAGGRLLWLAVAPSKGGAVVFSEAGELLYPPPERLAGVIYGVEEPDGRFGVLSAAEFRRRIRAPSRPDSGSAKGPRS